jgi:hypothetical protein
MHDEDSNTQPEGQDEHDELENSQVKQLEEHDSQIEFFGKEPDGQIDTQEDLNKFKFGEQEVQEFGLVLHVRQFSHDTQAPENEICGSGQDIMHVDDERV